jgi:chromate transport protein ChrA
VGSFSGICLELGLGVAIGMLTGSTGLHGSARGRMVLLAAAIGVVVGFLLAGTAEVSGLLGAFFCLLGATVACIVVSDIVHGAGRRQGGGAGALGFLVSLAALLVVGISIVFPYLSLLILAGLIWLALRRRNRAQRKHAGLRVLR